MSHLSEQRRSIILSSRPGGDSHAEYWQTLGVLDDVAEERCVQRGRWTNDGDDRNLPMEWVTYLGAYFGYVAQAVFTWRTKSTEEAQLRYEPEAVHQLRTTLVKLAATAVAWIETIDRRIARREEQTRDAGT